MSYHGLGATCDIQSTTFLSPHLGAGKGCPGGMLQLSKDMGASMDSNGKSVCTTQLSCVMPTSTLPPPEKVPAESSTPVAAILAGILFGGLAFYAVTR